jgi:hypothetical protein
MTIRPSSPGAGEPKVSTAHRMKRTDRPHPAEACSGSESRQLEWWNKVSASAPALRRTGLMARWSADTPGGEIAGRESSQGCPGRSGSRGRGARPLQPSDPMDDRRPGIARPGCSRCASWTVGPGSPVWTGRPGRGCAGPGTDRPRRVVLPPHLASTRTASERSYPGGLASRPYQPYGELLPTVASPLPCRARG